jgi:hypothetical protein
MELSTMRQKVAELTVQVEQANANVINLTVNLINIIY